MEALWGRMGKQFRFGQGTKYLIVFALGAAVATGISATRVWEFCQADADARFDEKVADDAKAAVKDKRAADSCASGSWEAKGEGTVAVGDIVSVTFTSAIRFENLWSPFVLSGPVNHAACTFADGVADIMIDDITNVPGLQPDWWGDAAPCNPEEPEYDGQIWAVGITFFEAPMGGTLGPCYFWCCENGASSHAGTFLIALTNMETVGLCTYKYTADTTCEIRWDHCMDANGATADLVRNLTMPNIDRAPGDVLSLAGTYNGCLHKGTAGDNYIRQVLSCTPITIDESDWEEFFYGVKARGYGDGNTVRWEAVEDFAGGVECANGSWGCGHFLADPRLAVDKAGRVWLAIIQDGDVLAYWRDDREEDGWVYAGRLWEVFHEKPSVACYDDGRVLVTSNLCDGGVTERKHALKIALEEGKMRPVWEDV